MQIKGIQRHREIVLIHTEVYSFIRFFFDKFCNCIIYIFFKKRGFFWAKKKKKKKLINDSVARQKDKMLDINK